MALFDDTANGLQWLEDLVAGAFKKNQSINPSIYNYAGAESVKRTEKLMVFMELPVV